MYSISSKIVKARKEHTCDLCCNKIDKGKKYRNQFNIESGETYTFKMHTHCENIAMELKMWDECYGGGLNDENFQETIKETFIQKMEIYHSEVFNYEHYQYPDFEGKLKFLCEHYEIPFNK